MGPIAYILFLMQYILVELTIGRTDDPGIQNYKILTSATSLGTSCFPEIQLILIPSCKLRIKTEIKIQDKKGRRGEEKEGEREERKWFRLGWLINFTCPNPIVSLGVNQH